MAAEGSRRAIVAAMLANAGIAVAKFVAFLFTRSSSMLAESIHSVADTSNQGLLLLGSARARREATPEHPFGFGRERYFWSFIVALVIFALGSLFSLFEGVEKLRHPHDLESPAWAIGVLLVAIVLESFSMRTAVKESSHLRGERSWVGFIRHARTPELPVVLLEDAGALLGLVLALIGVALATTVDPVYDALGTLSIGVLLGVIAVVLAIEMKSLLIGESATRRDLDAIRAALTGHPSVLRLVHLRTEHLGPDELLVAAKLEFAPQLDAHDLAQAIDEVETAVRDRVPVARLIYLEPGLAADEHARHQRDGAG